MKVNFIVITCLHVFISACTDTGTKTKLLSLDQIKSLADSAYKANDFKTAIHYYSRFIELDTLNGECYYRRGFSYTNKVDLDSSSTDLMRSIKLGYRIADSYYLLGINEIPKGNDTLAIYYLKKSLEYDSSNIETKGVLIALESQLGKTAK